jgi:hypothetical protein
MKLLEKQKIYSDGRHNAFTDLIYFKRKYFLAFRNGTSHLSWDGKIVLLSSTDGKEWTEFKKFLFANRLDARDPKLFLKGKRMFLGFPLRMEESGKWQSQIFVTSTQNGKTFNRLKRVYRVGFVNWRPKTYKKYIYAPFYYVGNIEDFSTWGVELYYSSDGFSWRPISTIYEGDGANETEIEFVKDKIIAVIRREGKSSILAIAKPPYTNWEYKDLGRQLHSPCIKTFGKKIFLAVRDFEIIKKRPKKIADEIITKNIKHKEKVSLFSWNGKTFKEALVIEEGKNIDCGYCGMERDIKNKNCILISYYLGNANSSEIWIARVKI